MRICEPSGEITTVNDGVGAVYLPQVGAAANSDAGRDAQAFADHYSMRVIAADRPGAGNILPRPGLANRIATNYEVMMGELGETIAADVAMEGLTQLVVVGRSAGATAALSLAKTETLPITSIFAAEPVGWYNVDAKAGRKKYNQYLAEQARMHQADDKEAAEQSTKPRLVKPEPSDAKGLEKLHRLLTIPPYALNDIHANQKIWSTPIALKAADYIAQHMPSVFCHIEFAEFSMAWDDTDAIKVMTTSLRNARIEAAEDSVPFHVSISHNTTHNAYELRSYFAHRARHAVGFARYRTD